MAFGTLYTRNPNPRSFGIIAVAKLLDIDLAVRYLDRENAEDEALLYKLNPLRQVPIFVGEDGFVLTECVAILLYVASQKPSTPLLGSSPKETAQIQKWLSFANSDLLPSIGGIILPLLRLHVAVQKDTQDCLRALHADLALLQSHLEKNKYLVGEEVTVADYFTAGTMVFGVMVMHALIREEYPRVLEWFFEVHGREVFKGVVGEVHLLGMPYPKLEDKKVGGVGAEVVEP